MDTALYWLRNSIIEASMIGTRNFTRTTCSSLFVLKPVNSVQCITVSNLVHLHLEILSTHVKIIGILYTNTQNVLIICSRGLWPLNKVQLAQPMAPSYPPTQRCEASFCGTTSKWLTGLMVQPHHFFRYVMLSLSWVWIVVQKKFLWFHGYMVQPLKNVENTHKPYCCVFQYCNTQVLYNYCTVLDLSIFVNTFGLTPSSYEICYRPAGSIEEQELVFLIRKAFTGRLTCAS